MKLTEPCVKHRFLRAVQRCFGVSAGGHVNAAWLRIGLAFCHGAGRPA